MDINFGFGFIVRVRRLKASRERKHIFVRRDESPLAMKERHDVAHGLLEARRQLRLTGVSDEGDLADIERRIKDLGYKFIDEPDTDDGRFSYWRYR